MGETRKEDPTTKAFFFLRHNNDIDHITPVLYKWLSTQNVPTDVIIISNRSFLNDYRIKFLKKYKNVRIFFLQDLFKKYSLTYLYNIFYYKYTTELDNLIKKHPIIKSIANRHINKIANQLFKGVDKGIVVFDWTTTYFVQKIVQIAKNKKFTTISLPHGDRVYISQLDKLNDINYDSLNIYKPSDIFNYIVVPNQICSKRYRKFLDENKIKVLGSSRYNDEWMSIISKLVPSYEIKEVKDKLKIVIFLRNTGFPIFWEEVIRTIKLIVQFPEIFLIVKHHPRNRIAKKLTKKLISRSPELKKNLDANLKFIYEDVNSVSLIQWADIVIDLGTSIVWEAIKQEKPVLMLEYVNANYSIVSEYMKESEMKCRDHLYIVIQNFIKNRNLDFYNEKNRRKFIKDMIDVPDGNVLEKYCNFLKMCLNESDAKK